MNIVIIGAGTAGLIAALMLREKYPVATITIVKSGAIGTIGVGEGSTEHWDSFMRFVGIDHLELLQETRSTIKIGILFKNWSSGSDYVHSISDFALSPLNTPEQFNHLYLNSEDRQFPLSPFFEHIYSHNNVHLTPEFRPSNQYHFDTFKLAEYLMKKNIDRGAVVIDTIVNNIILDSNGNIQELITSDSDNITGDLFIDCSGFRRVLSNKLGVKWVSKTDYLPLNRAIAFPTNLDNPDSIEPYTTSTALSAGWSWKIPTQDRYGNGYVFNTNFMDSDNALSEINQLLGKNVEECARDIPFEAGKVDKFWFKNCISVGLAGSFAEPLEAQSIGFTIVQIFTLIEYLDTWQHNKNISEKFNTEMDNVFSNVVDYLQLHYMGDRTDTEFWKAKPFLLTDFNKENIPLFKRGIFSPIMFQKDFMFQIPNFYQVAAGLKLINKESLLANLAQNRQTYNLRYYNDSVAIWKNSKSQPVVSHSAFIKICNFNYLNRKKLNES